MNKVLARAEPKVLAEQDSRVGGTRYSRWPNPSRTRFSQVDFRDMCVARHREALNSCCWQRLYIYIYLYIFIYRSSKGKQNKVLAGWLSRHVCSSPSRSFEIVLLAKTIYIYIYIYIYISLFFFPGEDDGLAVGYCSLVLPYLLLFHVLLPAIVPIFFKGTQIIVGKKIYIYINIFFDANKENHHFWNQLVIKTFPTCTRKENWNKQRDHAFSENKN